MFWLESLSSLLLQLATQSAYGGLDLPAMWGMKDNEAIIAGQYWRLITPMFLHGSILHIAFNLYALFIFGPGLRAILWAWKVLGPVSHQWVCWQCGFFPFSAAPSLVHRRLSLACSGRRACSSTRTGAYLAAAAQRALTNLIVLAVINLVLGMSAGDRQLGAHRRLDRRHAVRLVWRPGAAGRWSYPSLKLVNQREGSSSLRAGVGVVTLFRNAGGFRDLLSGVIAGRAFLQESAHPSLCSSPRPAIS